MSDAWTAVETFADRYAQMQAENEKLKKELDALRVINICDCEADTEFRTVAGSYDHSDSYGVESHEDILQRVLKELATATQREARVREALQALITANDNTDEGLANWALVWDDAKKVLEEVAE